MYGVERVKEELLQLEKKCMISFLLLIIKLSSALINNMRIKASRNCFDKIKNKNIKKEYKFEFAKMFGGKKSRKVDIH